MPAMLDDPTAPVIYRVSGPHVPQIPGKIELPPTIISRQVTLRDRTTIATLLPFSSASQVPPRLMQYLADVLNAEIEKGDTYPMISQLPLASFGSYWFQNFGAVMFLGEISSLDEIAAMEARGVDWKDMCLGSFYIKPNYPGRSSHVCNAGFLVTNASRNRGVGRLMGEGYLDWAPKLGYTYSVFNLVYETNTASIRIWDALGFKRIGRVKGCGSLASYPDTYIDAIIFGRDLGPDSEDFVSEERFDKIRYYLKHQKYPVGADRAEKSRLRSAATHYHLVPGADGEEERLMLKDKEVIADPQRQYEIAMQMHQSSHGGINKTTATIAEKYHWVRIKETVSMVIKNCADCKESGKVPAYGKPDNSNGTMAPTTSSARRNETGTSSSTGSGQNLSPATSQEQSQEVDHQVSFGGSSRSFTQAPVSSRSSSTHPPSSQPLSSASTGLSQPSGERIRQAQAYQSQMPQNMIPVQHQHQHQQHSFSQTPSRDGTPLSQPSLSQMQLRGFDAMPLDPSLLEGIHAAAAYGMDPGLDVDMAGITDGMTDDELNSLSSLHPTVNHQDHGGHQDASRHSNVDVDVGMENLDDNADGIMDDHSDHNHQDPPIAVAAGRRQMRMQQRKSERGRRAQVKGDATLSPTERLNSHGGIGGDPTAGMGFGPETVVEQTWPEGTPRLFAF